MNNSKQIKKSIKAKILNSEANNESFQHPMSLWTYSEPFKSSENSKQVIIKGGKLVKKKFGAHGKSHKNLPDVP